MGGMGKQIDQPARQAVKSTGVFRHRLAAAINSELQQLLKLRAPNAVAPAVRAEVDLLKLALETLKQPVSALPPTQEERDHDFRLKLLKREAPLLWAELVGEK